MDNFLSGCKEGRLFFSFFPLACRVICRCQWMPVPAAMWRHGALRKAGKEVWIQNTRSCV